MGIAIKSDRMVVREIEISDAKSLLNYLKEPKINTLIELPKTLSGLEKYIREKRSSRRWVITLRETNEVIGSIVLKNISQKHQRADIGYRIGANYEWKWYMTEILSCFCEYVFSEKEIQRIQARIREDNSASIKLAENIWFIYEGKARNFMKKNGIFYDFLLYGLIKKEKDKKSLW